MPDLRVPSLGADGKLPGKYLPAASTGADGTRLKPRGEFAAGVAYAVNDLVHVGKQTFYALQAHTSAMPAPTASSAYWEALGGTSGGGSNIAGQVFRVFQAADGTWPVRTAVLPTGASVDWVGWTIPPVGGQYLVDGVDTNTVIPAP